MKVRKADDTLDAINKLRQGVDIVVVEYDPKEDIDDSLSCITVTTSPLAARAIERSFHCQEEYNPDFAQLSLMDERHCFCFRLYQSAEIIIVFLDGYFQRQAQLQLAVA